MCAGNLLLVNVTKRNSLPSRASSCRSEALVVKLKHFLGNTNTHCIISCPFLFLFSFFKDKHVTLYNAQLERYYTGCLCVVNSHYEEARLIPKEPLSETNHRLQITIRTSKNKKMIWFRDLQFGLLVSRPLAARPMFHGGWRSCPLLPSPSLLFDHGSLSSARVGEAVASLLYCSFILNCLPLLGLPLSLCFTCV